MNKTLIALATLAAFSTGAVAKDSKIIEKNLAVESGKTLRFTIAVGSLTLETCQCDEVSMRIKVESSEGSWSLFSSKDVDDAELNVRDRSGGIYFEVEEEDTKQQWVVTVPEKSGITVEMGVGEVEIDDFNNDLDAEIGVGELTVNLASQDYDSIRLETGVGNAKIRSMTGDISNNRAMVSDSVSYSGDGKYAIKAEIGVGDIQVRGH